jgi:hypothetical protein
MPNLPAEALANTKKRNAPRFLNNTLIAPVLQLYSERLGHFTFGVSLSALESKAAEEGAKVDINRVAVEDVVANQDVLDESPSA